MQHRAFHANRPFPSNNKTHSSLPKKSFSWKTFTARLVVCSLAQYLTPPALISSNPSVLQLVATPPQRPVFQAASAANAIYRHRKQLNANFPFFLKKTDEMSRQFLVDWAKFFERGQLFDRGRFIDCKYTSGRRYLWIYKKAGCICVHGKGEIRKRLKPLHWLHTKPSSEPIQVCACK